MAWQIPRPRLPVQVPSAWVDITDTVKVASSELESGQLIMSGDTTLKDCMNAMELMDPKMDAAASIADHTPVAAQLESGALSLDLPQGGVEAVTDTLLRMLVSCAGQCDAGTPPLSLPAHRCRGLMATAYCRQQWHANSHTLQPCRACELP